MPAVNEKFVVVVFPLVTVTFDWLALRKLGAEVVTVNVPTGTLARV
jgi:hypothetical protein